MVACRVVLAGKVVMCSAAVCRASMCKVLACKVSVYRAAVFSAIVCSAAGDRGVRSGDCDRHGDYWKPVACFSS